MASLQSHLIAFWLHRFQIFGSKPHDPVALRQRERRFTRQAPPVRPVQLQPITAGGVPAEWLIPPGAPADRALLYFHGGAWFMGSPSSHRRLVSHLALLSRVRALSIDYRLAPEHPFPAALDDCQAAFDWLQTTGIPAHKIVVAGDSAGGNLALALLVARRDAGQPLPAAAVALSPVTDLAFTSDSHRSRRSLDPMFSNMAPNTIVTDYAGSTDPCHPLLSPLYADLHGLPPLLIHAGDHEILLDDAVRFGEKAAAAGVDVQTVIWPGMFHVFQIFLDLLPEARQANAQIAAFIRERLA